MSSNITVSMTFEQTPIDCPNFDKVKKFVLQILNDLKLTNWELSILFCNDSFIHNLNKEYRKIDSPTDVLSFEQGYEYFVDDECFFIAGDVVISLDSLHFNSQEFSVDLNEELKRLLVHGVLHLNGMDHLDNSMDQEMLQIQENLLKNYVDQKLI